MADYIMQDIEFSSSPYEKDPGEMLVQPYDRDISKYKSFFHNFRTQPTIATL